MLRSTIRGTLRSNLIPSLTQSGVAGGGVAPSLLLDTYTGAAAAYSLRKLRNGYSGSAIRVRRASDSAEQDIGFSGNGLDTTSLTSFCTGTDGFVTTWYDQSGNSYNASQTTLIAQPKIYDSVGGVYIEEGLPALYTKNVTNFVSLRTQAFSSVISQPTTVFATFYYDGTTGVQDYVFDSLDLTNRQTVYHALSNNTFTPFAGIGVNPSTADTLAGAKLLNCLFSGASSSLYKNGSLYFSGDIGAKSIGGLTLFNYFGQQTPYNWNRSFYEFVLFDSNQSSNRTGIESDIATYYGITLA